MNIPPIIFAWDGEAMKPATRFMATLADKNYVIGENYRLAPHQARSNASHNHYFASVEDAWRTLPEHLADDYPSSEHLRKKALIRAGFADERSVVCASKAEALRVAAFVRPLDDYAIVTVSKATVHVYTAKSQSMRAMGAAEFQASKEAVFTFLDSLLEIAPGITERTAGSAA